MACVSIERFVNFILRQINKLHQFFRRWFPLVFLFKLISLMGHSAQRTLLIEWHSDQSALFCNGLQDTLSDPPNGIRYKLKASCLVKFFSSLDESYIALVDEVGQ